MKARRTKPKNIDEYIADFPSEVQEILEKIRSTIRKAAPGAQETISYKMPAFALQGMLIFFAAYKHHIGLYPAPRGVEQFKKELSAYEGGKGTIKFSLDQPIPYRLIGRIVKFRAKSNLAKAKAKGKK